MPEIHTLFCLVNIKKRSFLTSCNLYVLILEMNASSHFGFRFFHVNFSSFLFFPAHSAYLFYHASFVTLNKSTSSSSCVCVCV